MKKSFIKNAIKTVTAPFSERADTREESRRVTRLQRRALERINIEITQTYKSLCEKFMEFIMSSDEIDKEKAKDKITVLHAQWVTYCNHRHLNEKAHNIVKDYCVKLLNNFFKAEEVVIK